MNVKLKVIKVEGSGEASIQQFEDAVNSFLSDIEWGPIQATFQRNLFYPRADFDESGNPTWGNQLQETYTAFILYEEGVDTWKQ